MVHWRGNQREPLLSAVVIARNEEKTIGDCLASVQRALDEVGGEGIVLVDSASTDRTAAIALERGCRVIVLRKASRICPSAARRIGAEKVRSRYMLFMDGDCILEPGFIAPALETMESNPSLGVVAGGRVDLFMTKKGLASAGGGYYDDQRRRAFGQLGYGGCALYRRTSLEAAGSFDPFLRAKEEEDLAQRIRMAGFQIRILSIPMIRHLTVPRESIGRLLRSVKHGFFIGRGQAARIFLGRGEVGAAFRGLSRLGYLVLHTLLGALCLATLMRGLRWPLYGWLALTVIAGVVFAWRSRSLTRPTYYVAEWMVQAVCFGIGFFSPRRTPALYRWEGEDLLPGALHNAERQPPGDLRRPPESAARPERAGEASLYRRSPRGR